MTVVAVLADAMDHHEAMRALRRLAVIRAGRERDRTAHYVIVNPFPTRYAEPHAQSVDAAHGSHAESQ